MKKSTVTTISTTSAIDLLLKWRLAQTECHPRHCEMFSLSREAGGGKVARCKNEKLHHCSLQDSAKIDRLVSKEIFEPA
jgi:hypothetical protein